MSVNASTAHFTPAVFILIAFLPMRERERERVETLLKKRREMQEEENEHDKKNDE